MATELDNLLSNSLLPLYRAARGMAPEEFQDAVWALIHECLRFDSGRWGTAMLVSGQLEAHRLLLHREPAEIMSDWHEVRHQDKAVKLLEKQGGTVSFSSSAFYAGKETSAIREYAARNEHRNCLVSSIRDPREVSSRWFCLYRASENDSFTPRDRLLSSKLFLHLEEALAINCMSHLGRFTRGTQEVGCAVIDRQGMIYHAESEFLALLAEELSSLPGKRLPAEMADALATHRRFSGKRIVIEAREGGGLLFLKGRLISAMDSLAPRELEVARLVSEGLSHKQIAARLKLSPATVRNTIQHIHDKLETHSLAALTSRVKEVLR